jgi:hypothetical protein
MKNAILIFILCIPSIQCYCQVELPEIVVYEDTTISLKVQIVDFGNYKGYIFPKEYGEIKYGHPKDKRECFDIDTILIRKIDSELVSQYFSAHKYFMEQRFNEMYEYERQHPGSYDVESLKQEEKTYWEKGTKAKEVKRKMLIYLENSDRQYLGYYSKDGKQIVEIQITPHSYNYDKKLMTKRFTPIWLSEEGSDVIIMHYHIDNNKLTVNEDF